MINQRRPSSHNSTSVRKPFSLVKHLVIIPNFNTLARGTINLLDHPRDSQCLLPFSMPPPQLLQRRGLFFIIPNLPLARTDLHLAGVLGEVIIGQEDHCGRIRLGRLWSVNGHVELARPEIEPVLPDSTGRGYWCWPHVRLGSAVPGTVGQLRLAMGALRRDRGVRERALDVSWGYAAVVVQEFIFNGSWCLNARPRAWLGVGTLRRLRERWLWK